MTSPATDPRHFVVFVGLNAVTMLLLLASCSTAFAAPMVPNHDTNQEHSKMSGQLLTTCMDSLFAADQDGDSRLDRSEFGTFVSINSRGRVKNPLIDLNFFSIFYASACSQCRELEPEDSSCCLGNRANIVVGEDQLLDGSQYLNTAYSICGAVNEEIGRLFPSATTTTAETFSAIAGTSISTTPSSTPQLVTSTISTSMPTFQSNDITASGLALMSPRSPAEEVPSVDSVATTPTTDSSAGGQENELSTSSSCNIPSRQTGHVIFVSLCLTIVVSVYACAN